MRAIPLALLIAALAMAPAAAQKSRFTTPPPTAGEAGALRGSLNGAGPGSTTPAPRPAAPQALAPLLAPLAAPSEFDAGQCRLSCAQSYYFCLSAEAPETCPSAWGQCRAGCAAPRPGWSADKGS